ncbi:MAG: hypothetical protein A2Y48_09830 [Nitrospirae bacterium RIFCSPLOW2_12_42_9]|nr:MAG: hypothetical protein A2Z60_00040 [Nitrospirae bacterium RIFCSPLOWO2_02_42_7]OGW62666.1 MAG: hypothetical protein A2Y48_09830 [Nitrospirae bacterium RIFCSPLOW2_12_42_9]
MQTTIPAVQGQLAEAFSDLFILTAQLRKAREYGDPEALKRRIREMFDSVIQKGKNLGVTDESILQAKYALAAFIDETILSSSWSQKDLWSSSPLQYEFFKEHLAGVEFFNRLENIRKASPISMDILEIYYLCLIMGFEGQYKLHGRDKLKSIVEELSKLFRERQGEIYPLSPHGKRSDEFIEVIKQGLPSWVIVVSCFSIIFFFYLALSFMIRRDVSSTMDNLKQIMGGGL